MSHSKAQQILPHLVGSEEAARILGVKASTLQVWRSTGRVKLRYVKIGGKVRYQVADLLAFIDQGTREHTGQEAAL